MFFFSDISGEFLTNACAIGLLEGHRWLRIMSQHSIFILKSIDDVRPYGRISYILSNRSQKF